MRILKINKKYAGYVSHHADQIQVFEQPNDPDSWAWSEVHTGKTWTMKSAQRYAQRATRANKRVKVVYLATNRYVPMMQDQ